MSKFYRTDNSLVYWYCDIVEYEFSDNRHCMTATDLLVDVIIAPDGFVKVVDLDELADALQQGLIDTATMAQTLFKLNTLLSKIYDGSFSAMQKELDDRGL